MKTTRAFALAFIVFGMPHSDGGGGANGCLSCVSMVVEVGGPPIAAGLQDYNRKRDIREAALERLRLKMTHRLVLGDIVEEDANGHVTAIRHATTPPTWTRFKPGAVSPPNEDIVWGELE